MKRRGLKFVALLLATLLLANLFKQESVKAASVIDSNINEDVFGEVISSMRIYDNGKVSIEYQYGLRRIDVFYCIKGEMCDNEIYSMKRVLESDENNTYKGSGTYEFDVELEGESEYRVRVEAYVGTSSAYIGTESVQGSFSISSVQIVDTGETYLNGEDVDKVIKDSRIRNLMNKIKEIVNLAILPIIYSVTSLYLVVKGAILGVQIVKSADDAAVRKEKVGALKWLVIGVAITYAATTLVGVVTGFFKSVLNL